jgi:arylsulfatase A-like enzyme
MIHEFNLVPAFRTAQPGAKIRGAAFAARRTDGARTVRAALACAWLAVAAAGCAPVAPPLPPAPAPEAGAGPPAVVLISIDGLRPDAIEVAGARTLQALMEGGAWTLHARTVDPSQTLPSHTSMLTGVPPAVHGITWNDDRVVRTGRVGVPTVFDLLEAAGVETAAFVGKAKFRHLLRPGAPGVGSVPRGEEVRLAPEVTAEVLHHLRFHRPRFLFVHLSDPDVAGHALGWMGGAYRVAVRRSDAAVAHLVHATRRAYGEDVVIIVTSDHGGHRRHHSPGTVADVVIPWIAWGRGVVPGEIDAKVRTTDTAATVLALLGHEVPADWEGRPVAGVAAPPPALR